MRSDGYHTKNEKLILEYLEAHKDSAVSIADIKTYLEQQGDTANITTVYRRLDRLISEKLAVKRSSEDGKKALFQYIASDSGCLNHLHIQCERCSKIIHLDCSDSAAFAAHLAKEHGITLDFSKTILYGLCDDCRRKR